MFFLVDVIFLHSVHRSAISVHELIRRNKIITLDYVSIENAIINKES